MSPYDGLYFFYLLFLALIPAIIMGFCGKNLKHYGLIITIIFMLIIFRTKGSLLSIILFYFGELFLVKFYLYIRNHYKYRWLLWITLISALLPLFLIKFKDVLPIHRNIGFIGVSYLTFKVIQILIEIYDGLIKEISIKDFTYFLLFFPTISSGPIDRSRRFKENINKKSSREEYSNFFKDGIWKIAKGLTYKFVIGAIIYNYWLEAIPKEHTLINTINYMYCYSFYLFFDFAGYSSMAIGVSYILGVATPENFNMPFLSRDIKDFWNRWHMTLSFWFRDFLYTRFVMSSIKNKWFNSKYTASYIGFLITMCVMGIWHGTKIFYILYGIYHGILIILTDIFERKSKWYKEARLKNSWNLVFTFITFNLVCFGFLIFSGYMFIKN